MSLFRQIRFESFAGKFLRTYYYCLTLFFKIRWKVFFHWLGLCKLLLLFMIRVKVKQFMNLSSIFTFGPLMNASRPSVFFCLFFGGLSSDMCWHLLCKLYTHRNALGRQHRRQRVTQPQWELQILCKMCRAVLRSMRGERNVILTMIVIFFSIIFPHLGIHAKEKTIIFQRLQFFFLVMKCSRGRLCSTAIPCWTQSPREEGNPHHY